MYRTYECKCGWNLEYLFYDMKTKEKYLLWRLQEKRATVKLTVHVTHKKIKIIWRRKYQRAGRAEQIESST